jgi:hypothetical protein
VTTSPPLHIQYRNVEGPLAPYCEAEPWTHEMQQKMQDSVEQAYEPIDLLRPLIRSVKYHCPSCEMPQGEIRFESLLFYADEDSHRLDPLGEAQLITMASCGHRYRREA